MARDAYLIRRGNQFYLRLAIPRPIRSLFPSSTGKPRDFISEPLGRNYDPARVECDRRVADYRALFARASDMTPEAIRDEIAAIKQRAEGRRSVADLPMLQSELERIRRKGQEANERTARRWASPEFLESSRNIVRSTVERMTKGSPIQEGSAAWNEIADKVIMATLLPSNSIQQGDETTPLG